MQQLQWHKINHIGEVFQTKNTHFHKYLVLKHKYVLKLIKIFTQMGKLIKKKNVEAIVKIVTNGVIFHKLNSGNGSINLNHLTNLFFK